MSNVEPSEVPQPTAPLTRAERELLLGFENAIRQYGNPSIREIALCAGPTWHPSNTHEYLLKLAKKGYVRMPPKRGRIRGIRLLFNAPPIEEEK